MNKIDEQPDRGSHTVGGGVDASAQGAPSLPGSQAITVETAAFRAVDPRSEPDDLLQTVSSKTTSRRAWLRRGVAVASPVVASLVSAPVYGAGCLAGTPSSFASATHASHQPGVTLCAFLGPNFWIKSPTSWPGVDTANVKFQKLFGKSVEAAINSGSLTLFDVLSGGTKYSDLAKYSIAAYLNALKPTADFPLTTQQAVDVYNSYYPGTVKTPLLVDGWMEMQTVSWLAMLMPKSS